MRHNLLACLVLVAAPFAAGAQTIDALPFTLGAPKAVYLPSAGTVEVRRLSHLVWDVEAGRLAQRSFEILDRFGGPELEVTWQPRDAAAVGLRPTGTGTLSWRRSGSAPYDTRAIVALYRGELIDGKLSGEGEFWHRAGLHYAGSFEDGLFSGWGRLQHPGGDYYEGAFRGGLYHGAGRLVTASGMVFEGTFVNGKREGSGLTSPVDGRAYTSLWRAGEEVDGRRSPLGGDAGLAHLQKVQAVSYPDAVLGISVNQSLPQGVSPDQVTLYNGVNDGRRLVVQPGDAEMMAHWLGGGPIPVSGHWDPSPFTYDRFQPVNFTVALDYSGTRPVRVTGGYVEVRESRTISRPAVELRRGSFCGGVAGELSITNHVIPPMNDVSFEYLVPGGGGRSITENLPDGSERATGSPLSVAASAGVDLDWLSENLLSCPSDNTANCIDSIRATGRFGNVANRIYGSGQRVLMDVEGRLRYSFPDADGQTVHVERDFTVPIKLGSVSERDSECGAEMSEPLILRDNPFMLNSDGTNYRLSYSLEARVNPGTRPAWVFQFDAPLPSRHVFQVYLQLSDGRTVATREVDLTYFTHRFELEDF